MKLCNGKNYRRGQQSDLWKNVCAIDRFTEGHEGAGRITGST